MLRKNRTLIREGGAVGHLNSLTDNRDLTFGELKEILELAAEGKLERVSEKFDGQNCVFSWDATTGEVMAARNSGDIKTGGMDAAALAAKFAGRGSLTDAFTVAFKVLTDALGALDDTTKVSVFGDNTNRWYSMEIIYTDNPNVINYDSNNIVFHGWPIFHVENGVVTRDDNDDGVQILKANIEAMQKAVTVKNWRVNGPALVRLKGLSDGSVLQSTLTAIEGAQGAAGVSDAASIGEYLRSMLEKHVSDLGVDGVAEEAILARCMEEDGAPGLVQIKKLVGGDAYPDVAAFVKGAPAMFKKFIAPIEHAVHKFSLEVLKGLESTLIDDSDAEVVRLRHEVSRAIKAIEASGQDVAMDVLKQQMQKLQNVETINSPMEGIVFIYKGEAYKLTGNFAPAGQILGLFRYGRKGVKLSTEARLRQYVRIALNNGRPLL